MKREDLRGPQRFEIARMKGEELRRLRRAEVRGGARRRAEARGEGFGLEGEGFGLEARGGARRRLWV